MRQLSENQIKSLLISLHFIHGVDMEVVERAINDANVGSEPAL
jgi:hypothetical protein